MTTEEIKAKEINHNSELDCIYHAAKNIELEFYPNAEYPVDLYKRFYFKPYYILPSDRSADDRPHILGDWYLMDTIKLSEKVIEAIHKRMLVDNTTMIDRNKIGYKP